MIVRPQKSRKREDCYTLAAKKELEVDWRLSKYTRLLEYQSERCFRGDL